MSSMTARNSSSTISLPPGPTTRFPKPRSRCCRNRCRSQPLRHGRKLHRRTAGGAWRRGGRAESAFLMLLYALSDRRKMRYAGRAARRRRALLRSLPRRGRRDSGRGAGEGRGRCRGFGHERMGEGLPRSWTANLHSSRREVPNLSSGSRMAHVGSWRGRASKPPVRRK